MLGQTKHAFSKLITTTTLALIGLVPHSTFAQSENAKLIWDLETAASLTDRQIEEILELLAAGTADPAVIRQGYAGLSKNAYGLAAMAAMVETKSSFLNLDETGYMPDIAPLLDTSTSLSIGLPDTLIAARDGIEIAVNYARDQNLGLAGVRSLKSDEYAAYTNSDYINRITEAVEHQFGPGYVPMILPVVVGDQPAMRLFRIDSLPATAQEIPWIDYAFDEDGDGIADYRSGRIPESWAESVGPSTGFGGTPTISITKNRPIAMLDIFDGRNIVPVNAPEDTAKLDQANAVRASSGTGCGPGATQPCFLSSVSLHNDGAVQCSGVLVAPDWVLTAGHCACNGSPVTASIGQVTPDRFGNSVLDADIVGLPRSEPTPSANVPITAERYFFGDLPGRVAQNEFCQNRREWLQMPIPKSNDLRIASLVASDIAEGTIAWLAARQRVYGARDMAMLKLRRPLQLAGQSPVVRLGDDADFGLSEQIWLAGFGRNDRERAGGHKTILHGDLTALRCRSDLDASTHGCVPGVEMVYYDADRLSDSCAGDSGAPVYSVPPDGPPRLIAIVSRATTGQECGPGGINVLTTPPEVRDWIGAVVSAFKNSQPK